MTSSPKKQYQHRIPQFMMRGWLPDGIGEIDYATKCPHSGKTLFRSKGISRVGGDYDAWTIFYGEGSEAEKDFRVEGAFSKADSAGSDLISEGLGFLRGGAAPEVRGDERKPALMFFMLSLLMRAPYNVDFQRKVWSEKYLNGDIANQSLIDHFVKELDKGRRLEDLGLDLLPLSQLFNDYWIRFATHMTAYLISYGSDNKGRGFLIGDCPVMVFEGTHHEICPGGIAIPIGPNEILALVAQEHVYEYFHCQTHSDIIKDINSRQVMGAWRYVFGEVKAHRALIEKRLGWIASHEGQSSMRTIPGVIRGGKGNSFPLLIK